MKTAIHKALLFFFPFWLWAQEPLEKLPPLLEKISGDFIQNHVRILGSDLMEGRATGSRGERLAADYIKAKLKEYGIRPAVKNRSYVQDVPLHGSQPLPSSQLTFYSDGVKRNFQLGADYVLFNTGAFTFMPQPAPMVFVGYGIVAPEFDYDDYSGMDVRDKIVVYLSGEPISEDPAYFDGHQPTIYFYAEAKERIAISRGARGCLLIPNPDENQKSWDETTREFYFQDVRLAYSVTGIFSALLNPASAGFLFNRAEFSLEQLFQRHRESHLVSFDLRTSMSFMGEFVERDFFAHNILGQVRGTDEKMDDSYLILSAHYDHLGIGAPVRGDSIYNGVVDNAMGVAALLEMAQVFQKSPPKRSLLFLFLTGEEKGVLGSTYYIDNPVVPLYKSIANINIDGLAIFDTFQDVISFGTELSTLNEVLYYATAFLNLSISPLPKNFSRIESFARSDQIVFAKAGIPAALVMDGIKYDHLAENEGLKKHMYWMRHIYHSPFDDLNQTIDWPAAEQHCRLLFAFAWLVANAEEEPSWRAGAPYATIRLQSIAEKK